MRKRAGRAPNRLDGHCIECGVWVDVGEGWISTPYDREAGPAPLRCAGCHDLFAFLDKQMTSSEDYPDVK